MAELRLDKPLHLASLRGTIAGLRPRLIVLDPFVRLAAIDENSAAEVSGVLGSLRSLQRDFDVAVLVVYHMRKASAPSLGNQLRGSGDFAAWYDSALYLTRVADGVLLTASHRGAPSPEPVGLSLVLEPAPHLTLHTGGTPSASGADLGALEQEVLAALSAVNRPQSTEALRRTLRKRKADVLQALRALGAAGRVEKCAGGWSLAATGSGSEFPP